MKTLERMIQAVETGLLTANTIQGQPPTKFDLCERMSFWKVPGFSIALIQEGEIAWTQGFGLQETGSLKPMANYQAGSPPPVTTDTMFQAASISKPVTAMVALSLVEAGVLGLDQEVNGLLRSWRLPENRFTRQGKVTLRRLLSHTAGVSVSGYRGYPAGEAIPTLKQILDGVPPAKSEPVRVIQPPGQGFLYSGGGYMLIQQLLEDLTGRPLAALAQERIFDKLGMAHSTFASVLPPVYLPLAATAHRVDGQPVPGKWHVYPEKATASLWSTPTDLARLVVEILKAYAGKSGQVLSPQMTREMLTPQLDWMALGFVFIERDGLTRFDHPGWNEGFHSYMAGFPSAGQGVVWMVNGENGKDLGSEVMRGLARVTGWPECEQAAKGIVPLSPDVQALYAGRYQDRDEPEFAVEVIQVEGQLFMQYLSGGVCCQLHPKSEQDFFSLSIPDEITFTRDGQGAVDALLLGPYAHLARVAGA